MSIKLAQHLTNLQDVGDLHAFNATFKKRRAAAKAAGKGFMTYRAALARLRIAIIAHHMARRSAATADLLKAVFDDGAGKPADAGSVRPVSDMVAAD